MTYVRLASVLAVFMILFWTFAGVGIQVFKLLDRAIPPVFRHVYHELRPFYLPAVVVGPVTASMLDTTSAWTWANIGLNVWNWWWLRNIDDDDDRWKRRRKRLAERVSVVGGRLAVVPGGAS